MDSIQSPSIKTSLISDKDFIDSVVVRYSPNISINLDLTRVSKYSFAASIRESEPFDAILTPQSIFSSLSSSSASCAFSLFSSAMISELGAYCSWTYSVFLYLLIDRS